VFYLLNLILAHNPPALTASTRVVVVLDPAPVTPIDDRG
jgi:hypothetical protein